MHLWTHCVKSPQERQEQERSVFFSTPRKLLGICQSQSKSFLDRALPGLRGRAAVEEETPCLGNEMSQTVLPLGRVPCTTPFAPLTGSLGHPRQSFTRHNLTNTRIAFNLKKKKNAHQVCGQCSKIQWNHHEHQKNLTGVQVSLGESKGFPEVST